MLNFINELNLFLKKSKKKLILSKKNKKIIFIIKKLILLGVVSNLKNKNNKIFLNITYIKNKPIINKVCFFKKKKKSIIINNKLYINF